MWVFVDLDRPCQSGLNLGTHLVHLPPSSLAMTSALSSIVYAMELLELPKVMPMATRSPEPALAVAAFSLIWIVLMEIARSL